jgi:hypothetical protein
MKRIIPFEQYNLNEDSPMMQLLGSVLTGKSSAKDIEKLLPDYLKTDKADGSDDETKPAVPGPSRIDKTDDFDLETNYSVTPGNDDFALYMQHQQGPAGAAGIVKALNGTGSMHPDTVKTKSGVKYAHLVGNIPSDTPQVKRDLIKALDAGDQRTAAALFLNSWKEKWNRKSQEAKKLINDPKHAEVKKAIKQAADKYGVPFDFAIAVANTESGFNPKAGNRRYKGLFAMDPNQSYGGIVTPMGNQWADPYVNAENGVRLLRRQIVDFKKALGRDIATLNLSPWAKNLA